MFLRPSCLCQSSFTITGRLLFVMGMFPFAFTPRPRLHVEQRAAFSASRANLFPLSNTPAAEIVGTIWSHDISPICKASVRFVQHPIFALPAAANSRLRALQLLIRL